jgi:sec-independent protein translocase protein TatA
MFGRLGWMEILVIVVLLLILFGHSKIPTMMKNLANGINIFKKEMKTGEKSAPKKSVQKKSKPVSKKK